MHLRQLGEILRDVEIADCILPIICAHALTEMETADALFALHVPRAAGVASITRARQLRAPWLTDKVRIDPRGGDIDGLDTWVIDPAGNIAPTHTALQLLRSIHALGVPLFVSCEQAMEWGSRLNAIEHAALVDIQRTCSNAARDNGDSQQMLDLGTQSQFMQEAAEAFTPDSRDASAKAERTK